GIYRQAIDPNTGAFDQSRFNAMVGQSPEASWNAGAAMQQSGQAMAAQGVGAQEQFNAQQQRLTALSGLATPFMERAENGGTVSMDELSGLVDQARRANLLTDGDVYQAKSLMSQPGANPTDILRGWYFRNYSALQQMQQAKGHGLPYQLSPMEAWGNRVTVYDKDGNPISVPLGYTVPPSQGGIGSSGAPTSSLSSPNRDEFIKNFTPIAQNISARTGLPVSYIVAQAGLETGWGTSSASGNNNFFGISPGGRLASYRTPQEGADAYVNLVNNDPHYAKLDRTGTPQEIGDRFAVAGYNPSVPGGPAGPSYGTRIGSFAAGLTGDAAGGAMRPYQVASTGPTPPPPTGAGGPSPGQGNQPLVNPVIRPPGPYMGPQLEFGSKAYAEDQLANQGLNARISPLTNVLTILNQHPKLMTGPGQSNWNEWMQAFQAMGINLPASLTGANAGDVTAWQELSKFLKQYDMNIPGSNRSDLERLGTQASQPNTEQGRNAIAILVGKAIGNELMRVAKYRQFQSQNQGVDPATGWPKAANRAQFYNLETSDWASNQDAMAYASLLMPGEAVGQYLKGLPNDAMRRNFVTSLQDAKRLFPEFLGQ
ncbi:MAG TPA: glucosaminidase domain-containing protein, partial [Bryobacteraceae bacterium]|nr:glucosaminidase domain-containing protein [Bryobacteraceae bacterium]